VNGGVNIHLNSSSALTFMRDKHSKGNPEAVEYQELIFGGRGAGFARS